MPASDRISQLRSVVRRTTIAESDRLSARLNKRVILASEAFQHTGSFKFRAAYNLASNISASHIIAASSGNFGQALSLACRLLGKRATIVMPETSARSKIDSVIEYGGAVDLVDTMMTTRQARVEELSAADGAAFVASAFDHELVIEGNSTLADDIVDSGIAFDAVIAPVGGGGLTSGLAMGLERLGVSAAIYGAEPMLANDASRSIRAGVLVANEFEPQTIADGARTLSLGNLNFEILSRSLKAVLEVSEEDIEDGVRLLFGLANLKAEPTGALAVASLLAHGAQVAEERVVCVISGGNCDPEVYARILAG
jgi:threonine dehydratase